MTDYYHDCLGQIGKSSAISYVNCLLLFSKWLEKESNYQGELIQNKLENITAQKFWRNIGFEITDDMEDGYLYMRLYIPEKYV